MIDAMSSREIVAIRTILSLDYHTQTHKYPGYHSVHMVHLIVQAAPNSHMYPCIVKFVAVGPTDFSQTRFLKPFRPPVFPPLSPFPF